MYIQVPLIFRTVKGILSRKDSFLPALQELSTHTDSSYLLIPIFITISGKYFDELTVKGSESKAEGDSIGGRDCFLYCKINNLLLIMYMYLIILLSLFCRSLLEQFCTAGTSSKTGKKSAAIKYPFLTEIVQALTNK